MYASDTSHTEVPPGLKFCRTRASNTNGRRLHPIAFAEQRTWILLKKLSFLGLYSS